MAQQKPITLQPQQQIVYDFLVPRTHAAAWLGIGGGKTLSTLAVLQTVRPLGHILVVAPLTIARSTWIHEIENWGFPIRTTSFIVDDNDKPLTPQARKQLMADVFTMPPTMFFINQELLTQPSRAKSVVQLVQPHNAQLSQHIDPTASATKNPEIAHVIVQLLHNHDLAKLATKTPMHHMSREELSAQTHTQLPGVTKKAVKETIQELIACKIIQTTTEPCVFCRKKNIPTGCAACQSGLVDQMPRVQHNGKPTVMWPFPTVIIDESQEFSSHASSRFEALKTVRPAISRMIQLSGTPSPNGLMNLWSQMYLLDGGQALGQNITAFRNRWFTPIKSQYSTVPIGWEPKANAAAEIHAAIKPLAISAYNTALQLPPLTIQDVNVTLPHDVQEEYKAFKRNLVLEIAQPYIDKNGELAQSWQSIVADNAAVLSSKLMQFASGTIYTTDPDDPGTKGQYHVVHKEKIIMTEHLIRNTNGPVLLPYHFTSDKKELVKHFAKVNDIDLQVFDGSRTMIERWNNKHIQVLMIHPASAGHGLNLQHGGDTMIWFTLPFSLRHYMQTNGRLYRTGQKNPVTIHRLITKGTSDERMPMLLAEKETVQNQLLQSVSGSAVSQQQPLAHVLDDTTVPDDAILDAQAIRDTLGEWGDYSV